jgi:cytochrome bd ubiquinol oxidase subunit II
VTVATTWYWLIAATLAIYVVLDGYDLGVGILHLFVAKDEAERSHSVHTILPLWDGNEVWLLALAGTLVFAFPTAYAAAFSGFYLPLMIVLWLIIGRALAIELRHHAEGPVWRPFWDTIFAVTSVLITACFGLALGNVIRGVPIDAEGRFFEPLWTDLGVRGQTGIVDVYTVVVAAAVLAALALHGAVWLVFTAQGRVRERARKLAPRLWFVVLATTLAVTAASWGVQPRIPARMAAAPAGFVFPAAALAGLAGVLLFLRRGAAGPAFVSSCAYLAAMVFSAAYGAYPYVLASNGDPARGLTVAAAAAPDSSLRTALWWWLPGMALAAAYSVYVHRAVRGRPPANGH